MRKTLDTQPRPETTKGKLRQLRRDGLIPASISMRGKETKHCVVPSQKLAEILRNQGASAIIELKGTGEKGTVLAISRDIQYDAVSRKLLHVGFQRLSATEAITADIRLTLHGTPEEVKDGSHLLEQVQNTLSIRAQPDKLPTNIDVDVTDLQSGAPLHASAIPVNPDYEIITAPDTVIAVVHLAKRPVVEAEEEAAAPTEGAAAGAPAAAETVAAPAEE